MSSSSHEQSPLTRLVLVIVCLAIAGSFVAGIHYYAIDLPQQMNAKAPENYRECRSYQITCLDGSFDPNNCEGYCDNVAGRYGNPANYDECVNFCISWVTSH